MNLHTLLSVAPSWVGAGISIATIGTSFGIFAAIITSSYTIWKWLKDYRNDKARN